MERRRRERAHAIRGHERLGRREQEGAARGGERPRERDDGAGDEALLDEADAILGGRSARGEEGRDGIDGGDRREGGEILVRRRARERAAIVAGRAEAPLEARLLVRAGDAVVPERAVREGIAVREGPGRSRGGGRRLDEARRRRAGDRAVVAHEAARRDGVEAPGTAVARDDLGRAERHGAAAAHVAEEAVLDARAGIDAGDDAAAGQSRRGSEGRGRLGLGSGLRDERGDGEGKGRQGGCDDGRGWGRGRSRGRRGRRMSSARSEAEGKEEREAAPEHARGRVGSAMESGQMSREAVRPRIDGLTPGSRRALAGLTRRTRVVAVKSRVRRWHLPETSDSLDPPCRATARRRSTPALR